MTIQRNLVKFLVLNITFFFCIFEMIEISNKAEENETTTTTEPYSPTAQANLTGNSSGFK